MRKSGDVRGRAKGPSRARESDEYEVKRPNRRARKGTQTTKTSGTARIQRVPAGRRESSRVGYLRNGSHVQTVCMSKIVTRERTRLGVFTPRHAQTTGRAEAVKTLDVIEPGKNFLYGDTEYIFLWDTGFRLSSLPQVVKSQSRAPPGRRKPRKPRHLPDTRADGNALAPHGEKLDLTSTHGLSDHLG